MMLDVAQTHFGTPTTGDQDLRRRQAYERRKLLKDKWRASDAASQRNIRQVLEQFRHDARK